MASGYSADGPTSSNRRQHAKEHFRSVATDFLRSLGRLRPPPTPLPDQYDAMYPNSSPCNRRGSGCPNSPAGSTMAAHGFS